MKSQICAVGNHAVAGRAVRNQGFEFGRCRRCGRDMVRSHRRWRTVPRGFRVVWRRTAPAQAAETSAAQLLLNLPPVGRSLIPAGSAGKAARRLAAAVELALLALRGIAWLVVMRARTWLAALAAPRGRRGPALRLPAA